MTKTLLILFPLLIAKTTLAATPAECITKADGARAEMLSYKQGNSSEVKVNESTKDAENCIEQVAAKPNDEHKLAAISAWKAFKKMREEKILPTVVYYNKLTKDNKANLDKTKDALKVIGTEKANECISKADQARTALLLYKDGKGDEQVVNTLAKETSSCIDELDAKEKGESKSQAVAAWKVFRSIREGKIIPAVKSFVEDSKLNTENLNKTKEALTKLEAKN